ncbi:MAG: response regulator transcription factor [Clostridia bacterium]|nr:response regulator transcription factor [Clostridia bacterium]
MQSILIIDDNPEILDILDYHFTKNRYMVYKAMSGNEGLDILNNNDVSVIILDVMMEGENGFSLCEKIRKYSMVPILFLTAKTGEDDMIKGLLCGGDDYMIKPFSSKELLARVFALLRRERSNLNNGSSSGVRIHNLFLNKNSNEIFVKDKQIELTDIEHKTLLYLIDHRGKCVSTKEIFENVWKETYILASKNTVVVHIKNIRRKLQVVDPEYKYIHTIWGKGYAIY